MDDGEASREVLALDRLVSGEPSDSAKVEASDATVSSELRGLRSASKRSSTSSSIVSSWNMVLVLSLNAAFSMVLDVDLFLVCRRSYGGVSLKPRLRSLLSLKVRMRKGCGLLLGWCRGGALDCDSNTDDRGDDVAGAIALKKKICRGVEGGGRQV